MSKEGSLSAATATVERVSGDDLLRSQNFASIPTASNVSDVMLNYLLGADNMSTKSHKPSRISRAQHASLLTESKFSKDGENKNFDFAVKSDCEDEQPISSLKFTGKSKSPTFSAKYDGENDEFMHAACLNSEDDSSLDSSFSVSSSLDSSRRLSKKSSRDVYSHQRLLAGMQIALDS